MIKISAVPQRRLDLFAHRTFPTQKEHQGPKMAIATISDLRPLAKRRLPRFVFDYLDGGAGGEKGLQRNLDAFDEILLKPRMLMDVEERDFSTTLLGRKWSLPFG